MRAYRRFWPVLLLLVAVAAAEGQQAPLFLEPGHWSYDAVRRLNGAGLAPPASDPALAPLTVQHALNVFAHAGEAARERGLTDLLLLAEGYRLALLTETDTVGRLAASRARVGWAAARGGALGGDGYFIFEDWEGAVPLPSANGPVVTWQGHGHLRPWLSWSADGGWIADEPVLLAASVAAAAGPFDLWAGRRRLQYGMGRGGAVNIGGAFNETPLLAHRTGYVFEGIGGHVREPFDFPWHLRVLGPTRIEAVLGRLSRNGRIEGPFVAFGRLVGTPFTPRITLGVNRGAIFGGEGIPITAGRLLGLVFGMHGGDAGEFENQVFSIVGRVRPPLGPLPLELYAEWGMDDTSGAIATVPALITGLDIAAVPGLPALAVGIERTYFAESCCGNPIWYRSVWFRGSWADEGRLFAHPLGGHGTEWLGHARLDLPQHGVMVSGELYTRERGHENLFALERRGRSTGGAAGVTLLTRFGEVRVDAAMERAVGWDVGRLSATLSRDLRPARR
jgi:hypothetical protein